MIGSLLAGRYRLDARVGRGGMCTVWRAHDLALERTVAVKLLHTELSGDGAQLERFRREARAVARLSHPHIVTVIDAGEEEGRPYIVLEYVEGETLKERIKRHGRLPVTEAVAYAIEIARALACAHAQRLVHRDVKPQNVLIDREGRAKVTDFGIARSLESGQEDLTATGRVLGTTEYVAPEQALGERVTERSDLYSLGIVLFEMLTGAPPFRGPTPVATAMAHVREPLPDVQKLRPEVSASLAAVIERACAKNPERRHRNALELAEELEQVLAIETARSGTAPDEVTQVLRTLPREIAEVAPRRLRMGRAMRRLLALAALAATAVAIWQGLEHTRPGAGPPRVEAGQLRPLALPSTAAHDFDPEGDGSEHPESVQLAVDGNLTTTWETETYRGGLAGSGKSGVGLYIDTGRPQRVRQLDLVTSTPGLHAGVYGANSPAGDISGWRQLVAPRPLAQNAHLRLPTGTPPFRYYLLWITELPNGGRAEIRELGLSR